jgi:hypothetical protein
MSFERATKIADAVLYEGYLLYPYRASARKNQMRWQFGVLVPRAFSQADPSEHWWMQTECIVMSGPHAKAAGRIRFLQVQHRSVEKAINSVEEMFQPVESIDLEGRLLSTWDEAVERSVDFTESIDLAGHERAIEFGFPKCRQIDPIMTTAGIQAGRIVRELRALSGRIIFRNESLSARSRFARLRVRIENTTPWNAAGASREDAMRFSFASAHTLLEITGGEFISMVDPPEEVKAAAASCENIRTWPVLAGDEGDRTIVLSSPIILYDHPQVAPESPGDLFDGTEIDEILTLRTLTLTDEEKREARASDSRAAAIIDRVDNMPPEVLDRLHGTVRYLRKVTNQTSVETQAPPWWDPGADASVSPETDCVQIAGANVSRGSRVRLCPGTRRSDAQDIFLIGKTARVEGVFFDVDNQQYLAVTVEDDPAAELSQWYGRFLYFYPDEVEPLESAL